MGRDRLKLSGGGGGLRSVSELTAGWLWMLAGCTVLALLSAQGVLACPIPPFQWLRAQQISSCELHYAFRCCHWRLVREQHFHPCE